MTYLLEFYYTDWYYSDTFVNHDFKWFDTEQNMLNFIEKSLKDDLNKDFQVINKFKINNYEIIK